MSLMVNLAIFDERYGEDNIDKYVQPIFSFKNRIDFRQQQCQLEGGTYVEENFILSRYERNMQPTGLMKNHQKLYLPVIMKEIF